jgi:hypothetical protein
MKLHSTNCTGVKPDKFQRREGEREELGKNSNFGSSLPR